LEGKGNWAQQSFLKALSLKWDMLPKGTVFVHKAHFPKQIKEAHTEQRSKQQKVL
jgi:hypothetical protein